MRDEGRERGRVIKREREEFGKRIVEVGREIELRSKMERVVRHLHPDAIQVFEVLLEGWAGVANALLP